MDEAATNSAASFLDTVWSRKPDGTAIQLWEKRSKKTFTFTEHKSAAIFAATAAQGTDVYVAAGLAPRQMKPRPGRASNNEVAGIAGLWADLDINGGPDAHTNKAPTREDATRLAFALLEPTVLVNSGYGLQAWWLFDEPWIFSTADEREQAARLSQGFTNALRAQAARLHADWKIDSTFDLARLMRLPGTRNHKGNGSVEVSQLDHDGPRYDSLEAMWAISNEYMASTGSLLSTLSGSSVDVALVADPNVATRHDLVNEVCDIDQEFAAVWNHLPVPKTKNWSMSEYDMSIANTLAKVMDDQQLADALRYHRHRFGDEGGKGDRLDYIKRTIGKARAGDRMTVSKREAEFERNDNIEQLADIGSAPPGDVPVDTVVSLFNRVVGGPTIKELVQEGRDPDNSRFKLVLADGREVPLGPFEGLLSQEKFRARFAVVTGHLPRKIGNARDTKGPRWDDIVQALMNAAIIREGHEDTRAVRGLTWVMQYADKRISSDHDAACEALDPFEHEGYLWVPLGPLRQWVQKTQGDRIAEIDLKLMLESAGFERHTINYRKADKSKSTRSYYRIPTDALHPVAADHGADPEATDG